MTYKKAIATPPDSPTKVVDLSAEELAVRQKEESNYSSDLAKNGYKEKRLAEYPSFGEQLDKIFHEGLDAWKAEILAIKNKYPKPE